MGIEPDVPRFVDGRVNDHLMSRLLGESTAGCCADVPWRGRLCSYHQGYADGMDALADALFPVTRDEAGE